MKHLLILVMLFCVFANCDQLQELFGTAEDEAGEQEKEAVERPSEPCYFLTIQKPGNKYYSYCLPSYESKIVNSDDTTFCSKIIIYPDDYEFSYFIDDAEYSKSFTGSNLYSTWLINGNPLASLIVTETSTDLKYGYYVVPNLENVQHIARSRRILCNEIRQYRSAENYTYIINSTEHTLDLDKFKPNSIQDLPILPPLE